MFKPSRRYTRRTMPLRKVFFLSLLIFILFTWAGIWIVNDQMKPAVMNIAVSQAEQLGNYAINYGVGENVLANIQKNTDPNQLPNMDTNKLIVTHRNAQNEVSDYELNSAEANRIRGVISDRILWFLRMAEKGKITMTNGPAQDLQYVQNSGGTGMIANIPLGQILNNALLSNYGPRIPVEMDVVSNVATDIQWDYKNVGINNIIFVIYLNVNVKVNVIVPFAMQTATINQHIPIGSKVLPQGVPYYYSSGGSGSSPALPINPIPGSAPKGQTTNN
ncbi:sporulation protein YunB [Sporolactobacillus putidus]|uniref:Sporulation protein YunB n=1 Tax=Sporolactobacillus putidus TaxID=492735 RepID=A0A917S422_9BACL|nr:sporulation protein YunB [Sporolactobacillus putidus]GGL53229.1 sporulation protein YunB [Sporolactobacillus putidus]